MRALVTGLAAGLATLVVIAQPDAQPTDPPPDFAHAKELYDNANAAMARGDYGDAVRDYGAAYEITKPESTKKAITEESASSISGARGRRSPVSRGSAT